MRAIILILAVVFSTNLFSQTVWDEVDSILIAEGYDLSDTAYQNEEPLYLDDIPYEAMSQFEKDVLYYINYVRTNPKGFCAKYVLVNSSIAKNSYYTSLVKELMSMAPRNEYSVSPKLNASSRHHCLDLSKTGKISHFYSNGRLINNIESVGGKYDTALEAVLGFLVDDGTKSLGHRKQMLASCYSHIGISAIKYKSLGYITVIHNY